MILLPTKWQRAASGAEYQDSYPSSPSSFKSEDRSTPSSPPPPPPPAAAPPAPPQQQQQHEQKSPPHHPSLLSVGTQRMTRSASVQPTKQSNSSAAVRAPTQPPPASSFTPRILPSRPDDADGVSVTEELGDGPEEESLTRSFRVAANTHWLKDICKEHPPKRTIHWRQNRPRQILNDWHKAGILVQAIGDEQPTPCYRCSQGLGPFEPCVALRGTNGAPSSIHKGACGSCITTSHSRNCTFRPDHKPIEFIHGRSASVAPSAALTPSRKGGPNAFARKRTAPSQSVPPPAMTPPSSFRNGAVTDAAKVDKEPNNVDPHLGDTMARAPKGARRRSTRQPRQRRWSPELPPETEPESQDNAGSTQKQNGTKEEIEVEKQHEHDQQHENVRYEIPRAFREHRFVVFPDTLSPNEESAIGTALAEARAICDRLEGRLRKLRRASWVEDAE